MDLDVFASADALEPVFEAIRRAGCTVDAVAATESARSRGDFQAWYGPMRVDVFISSIPFYEQMRARVRVAPLEGRPARFLSPEDLAVMKLLFFRTKDLIDIERLVAVASAFDREYVTKALVELVGDEDSRLPRWRQLLVDVDALPPRT